MKFILMGLIKRFTKETGRSPNPVELKNLKKMAQEIESSEKVIPFPMGGKDKTDFFSTRPDPRVKQPKGAEMDVQRAHENLSGGSNYAQGDTKYNADVLADEIARQRKLIPDDGIADSSDLDFKTKTALYDEAYSYLTGLRMLNKKPKLTETDAEIIARMNKQNKDSVQRLKDKKEIEKSLQQLKDSKKSQKTLKDLLDEYDGDPDAMAMGGLAGALAKLKKKYGKKIIQKGKAPKDKGGRKKLKKMFKDFEERTEKEGGGLAYMLGEPRQARSGGGPIFKFLKALSAKSPAQRYKDYLASVKKRSIEGDFKSLAPELGAISAGGILVNRKMKSILEEGNELQKERFLKEYIEELNNDPSYKDRPELKDKLIESYTKSLFGENKAEGGRIGFADGGMSRRTFLKIMAALAAFPVVGKLAKTAKVAKGAAPIVTPTAEMPAHFPKLVEKIIREGQVVDRQFVKKTGDIKTYRHPDRADIELTIEGEGDRITLDFETDQGMRGGYEFKKGKPDEMATNPPNEFEAGEVKYKFSQDGESYSKDFEMGIDTGTENLDEFAGIGKQKTSKSKTKLPESLDDDFADGGLAGLLGE